MKGKQIRAITLAALMVFSVLAVAVPAAAAGTTDISLDGSSSVNQGSTVTQDIVVDNVQNDVQAYNVTVTSSDASVVEIDSISETIGASSIATKTVASDGSSATLSVAGGSTGVSNGNQTTVATVTLSGVNTGSSSSANSTVDVAVNSGPFDSSSTSYTIGSQPSKSISVPTVKSGLDVNGDGNNATDSDGDGKYEDVTGNGAVNIGDVNSLINGIQSNTIKKGDTGFNFNGDSGNEVNIGDVNALINQAGI